MLTRLLLGALLLLLIFRAIGRLFVGIAEGAAGMQPGRGRAGHANSPGRVPAKGEMMVQDPVCGTFVLPSRAVSARGPHGPVYFCSEQCRNTYQQR